MTAAYHLSGDGWQQRFAGITVHQLGWRLGGKGASGRNSEASDRIEEHGLHVWFGFYENAFRMLDACHRELDVMKTYGDRLARWPTHFDSVGAAFHPVHRVGLMEDANRSWRPWVADFPPRPGQPWDRDLRREPATWTAGIILRDYLQQFVELGRTIVRSLEGGFQGERRQRLGVVNAIDAVDAVLGRFNRIVESTVEGGAASAIPLKHLRRWLTEYGPGLERALATVDLVLDTVARQASRAMRQNEEVRRLWAIVDLVLAVARGLLGDRVADERTLDALDDVEFSEWLFRHGAAEESIRGPFVRAVVYDLAFAYAGGDARRPACGAATAIRGLHRLLFTYRGALMWKLNGGMGDVVFAPLYELLVKRGVQFDFFHQITDLVADGSRITNIKYRQQVPPEAPPDGERERIAAARQSLVQVQLDEPYGVGLCWPSHPSLPPDATNIDERARRLESTWWRDGKEHQLAVSDDIVVLGISIGALPYVASDLIRRRPQWSRAVDAVKTVPTEALQLWVRPSSEQLGWEPDAIVGGFGKPFDTWSDMPGPLAVEPRGERPGSLAYFCSVIDLSEEDPSQLPLLDDVSLRAAYASAWKRATEQLQLDVDVHVRRRLPLLWPGSSARASKGGGKQPTQGRPMLDIEVDRYERVNVDPTERYVLSVPGSRSARLRPDESGFSNLFLAGDWTECTLDAGCVEAAVISGMMAARAILRDHEMIIIGERAGR